MAQGSLLDRLRDPGERTLGWLLLALACVTARAAPPRILRSIRIGAHDKVATIGGVRVRVGDSVGQAVVAEIRATEVVLRDATGTCVIDPEGAEIVSGPFQALREIQTGTRVRSRGTATR